MMGLFAKGYCYMSQYKKLNKQPLKLVLAEFRFSKIMKISEYIPQIQEDLRKKYPILKKSDEQSINVDPSGISISTIDHWSFVTSNKKNAIDISQDRMVYLTSEYPRFKGFEDACKEVLDVLVSVANPGLITRLGLRYCDLVEVDEKESFTDLVDRCFLPPMSINDLGTGHQQRNETIMHTNSGTLIVRSLYGNHNLTCMPDVQNAPIQVELDQKASERIILDFDHYWEPNEHSVKFITGEVLERLSSLHADSRRAFWKITTDYARNEKWG